IFSAAEIHRSEADGVYAQLGEIRESALRLLEADAPPADHVVSAVMRALTARNPRLRYPVGAEARLLSACKGLVPERAWRRIARRMTGTQNWGNAASRRNG